MTYVLVAPLPPAVEAAWKARAEIFFAECRAAHDAMAESRIADIRAKERAALPMAA